MSDIWPKKAQQGLCARREVEAGARASFGVCDEMIDMSSKCEAARRRRQKAGWLCSQHRELSNEWLYSVKGAVEVARQEGPFREMVGVVRRNWREARARLSMRTALAHPGPIHIRRPPLSPCAPLTPQRTHDHAESSPHASKRDTRMPLLKRRPVALVQPQADVLESLPDDAQVFVLKATGEIFLDYE